ncbi:MAG TPA: DUF6789 family protein [Balneolales bacterium]|nr:DUF6789 family protein [Balneolales bacterium]
METNVLAAAMGYAALAGVAGAVVMLVLIYVSKIFGFKADLPYIMGTFFVSPDNKAGAYSLGFIIYFIIGALWSMFFVVQMMGLTQPPQWWLGIIYGFASGFLSSVLLGTMVDDHPNMGKDKAISDPGMFVSKWGLGNTTTYFALHVIFGLVTMLAYIHFHGVTHVPRVSKPIF